jgi:hypothetical protein
VTTEGIPVDRHRLVWIAHRAYLVTAAVAVAVDLTVSESARTWLTLPLIVVATVLMFTTFRHRRQLCGICADMTALDGNAAAERNLLRLYHPRPGWCRRSAVWYPSTPFADIGPVHSGRAIITAR